MSFTIFGFVVTAEGGGEVVEGRVYKEYHVGKYSPWLRKRVEEAKYWKTIRSCIMGSKTCAKIEYWTPYDYLQRDMSPIQVMIVIHFFLVVFCL